MTPGLFSTALKSIRFYRKQVVYQVLLTALLCAIITGSLLTGSSVRTSLKKNSAERLGNTGILISSGLRYFDKDLPKKFSAGTGISCTGLLEITGSSQGLISQAVANLVSIYAVTDDFFRFHGIDSFKFNPGEILINEHLATRLNVKAGDDVIIRFKELSDIPADAPFAPESEEGMSLVLKAGSVIGSEMRGNFSLSINQITPMNIFVSLTDIEKSYGKKLKFNRLLIHEESDLPQGELADLLKKIIEPGDIGIRIRETGSGGPEIVSDRVFIDEELIAQLQKTIPSASPVITYLANSVTSASGSTPYSFVSALPSSVYDEIPDSNGVIVNSWLSEDLNAGEGDSLVMSWFSPDSLNDLVERSKTFIIRRVVEMQGIWADSMLMPDFPGIAGSESCSDWDAGVPIKMDAIRDKDEKYWDRHKGTPKAFINYETGKEIWGSNFGPATSVRFPEDISAENVRLRMTGSLDPLSLGLFVSDIYRESISAAENSVDFGSLFISLGFFLILASFILLSFAVSYYFDTRKKDIRILSAMGFRNRTIMNLLFFESSLTGLAGCLTGAFAGYLVNIVITAALNSVWKGAVQTDTLSSSIDFTGIFAGFAVTFSATTIFMYIIVRRYLKSPDKKEKAEGKVAQPSKNAFLLVFSGTAACLMLAGSFFLEGSEMLLSFISGVLMLLTFILYWRNNYISQRQSLFPDHPAELSRLYYSWHPSHAITPVLFIAAGIFAFFIVSVNRKDFSKTGYERSSGTGGFLLWCESSMPLMEDLNSARGRMSLGLDDDSLSSMKSVQMKRSPGNDASCLNLNHITAPPLLGVDAEDFISRNAFSFSGKLKHASVENPWEYLRRNPGKDVLYGIADQTVLDWGLKLKVGDTLVIRAENGQPLSIIIAAGLQSSVFQGFLLVGKNEFTRYFPSVAGTSVILIDGKPGYTGAYERALRERLSSFGASIGKTTDRLAGFYQVTNTYLSVFGVFGGLGLITGIAGMGFVILRNYNRRKREFALMLATGFTSGSIRKMVFSEQIRILAAGVVSGIIPAIVATLPSIRGAQDIPLLYLACMVTAILATGLLAVTVSLRAISEEGLISALRRE